MNDDLPTMPLRGMVIGLLLVTPFWVFVIWLFARMWA